MWNTKLKISSCIETFFGGFFSVKLFCFVSIRFYWFCKYIYYFLFSFICFVYIHWRWKSRLNCRGKLFSCLFMWIFEWSKRIRRRMELKNKELCRWVVRKKMLCRKCGIIWLDRLLRLNLEILCLTTNTQNFNNNNNNEMKTT